MSRPVIFGGTTEGRLLAEALLEAGKPALVCVATDYGAEQITPSECVEVRTGRLDAAGIRELLLAEKPEVVVDATHPYALEVSANIRRACLEAGIECLRVCREGQAGQGGGDCVRFGTLPELIEWLRGREGIVFNTMGAKEAAAFTSLPDYRERVFIRILPSLEGLTACLELGYPARHIICMQGPFSQALNEAMFQSAGARILVTKDSGPQGGFGEKIGAAQALGMRVALLTRPDEADAAGYPLQIVMERIL